MIINTGSRTDTVQYYTDWLLNRFEKGYVYSRNPMYPEKITKYILSPDVVDCIVFCSKNYKPILPYIESITGKYNTYFFYTITAYGKDVEPNVPSIDESIETLKHLASIVGKQRIAWRYDPVLLTDKYTKNRHYQTFGYMTQKLAPYVDRCVFSFVDMYKKLKVNMPELIVISENDKVDIARNLGNIAKKYNMLIQTCATDADYNSFGILNSGCITSDILEKANNIKFKYVKHVGNRENCRCIETRNIGDYDTCPNGCKYCYANQNPYIAEKNYKKHNPNSEFILGDLSEYDEIKLSNQKSFLLECEQKKLF